MASTLTTKVASDLEKILINIHATKWKPSLIFPDTDTYNWTGVKWTDVKNQYRPVKD